MSDNIAVTPGSGATVAADDIGGVLHQRVKLSLGQDGSAADAPGDATSGLAVGPRAVSAGGWYPEGGFNDLAAAAGAVNQVRQDAGGNLAIRGAVLTDEGNFSTDFPGSALAVSLTGTPTWTNGSATVTGSGTAFLTQVGRNDYVKRDSDGETYWARVQSVESDTSLTLGATYGGTSGAAAGSVSDMETVTGTGGTIAVANSVLTISCGTNASTTSQVERDIDYAPIALVMNGVTVSQRVANQTVNFGFQDAESNPSALCRVELTGATNTTGNFVVRSSSAANDTTTAAFTFPNGTTSATSHQYRIELRPQVARLWIDGVLVANVTAHLPPHYTEMVLVCGITSTASSNTDLAINEVLLLNANTLSLDGTFTATPLPVQVQETKTVRISVTPTIDTTAMTSGDSLGALITFPNAVRAPGYSGILQAITVIDRSQAQRAAMDFLFFDRSVTVAANNAALAMSDADMANCLGLVSAGPYNTAFAGTPLNSISTLTNIGLPIVCTGTDLYAACCVRATPTYAVGDLTFILTILQD